MQRLHGFVLYFSVTLLLLLGLAGTLQAEWAYAAPVAAQSTATPVPLPPHPVLSDIVALNSPCGLTSGGSVKCWQGQSLSVFPGLEKGVQSLSSGLGKLCAVMVNGDLRCSNGIEGVPIDGFATAVRSVASGGPVCALLVNGGVQCMGGAEVLGPNPLLYPERPVYVKGLSSGVEEVVLGDIHACALLAGGQVQCWGAQQQLGNNATDNSSEPVQVSGLISGVVALAAGRSHTCALLENGSVRCWGDIAGPQQGKEPVTIAGLPAKAKAISDRCALLVNNTIACYSKGMFGLLDHYDPEQLIEGLADGATALDIHNDYGCALVAGGQVQCWGDNRPYQLGTGRATQHSIPFVVYPGVISGTQAVSAGEYRSCVIASLDSVYCWGEFALRPPPLGTTNFFLPYNKATKIATLAGSIKRIAQNCVLLDTGSVRCWSFNGLSNFVPVTTTNALTLYEPNGLGNGVVDLDTGNVNSCFVLGNGEVKCWSVIVTDPNADPSIVPSVPGLNVAASAVTSGAYHACALTQNQEVFCWGRNGFGQTGNGQTGTGTSDFTYVAPSKVVGLPATVVAISAGHYHTCALLATGGVKCWGANFNGQLGNDSLVDQGAAVDVIGLSSGVQALDLGNRHSCALLTNGGVKCWGANLFGAVGNGTTVDQKIPVMVTGLATGVKEVSAGADHTCALLTTGRVKCFGNDNAGQLGQEQEVVTRTPRYVLTGFVPQLSANFTDTQAGGVIALTGEHFPPSQTLLIRVNDVVYGAVQSSVLGELFFLVDTQATSASPVRIQVGEITQILSIDPAAPLRQAEGGGTTIRLSSAFQPFYLPLLMQNK